jgi:membrane-bound lytic murein transglycosylase D
VPRPGPNGAARRQIAGGLTAEEERSHAADPELLALREAERVLFPEPLVGARPGWSWEVPEAQRPDDVDDSGLPPALGQAPRPSPDAQADAEWLKGLTLPNLPVRFDPHVVKYLKFYRDSTRGRAIGRAWAKKSGRYAPALRASLARVGLPTDLVWLSLIESGHNPTIVSPAGAAGLWQFIPESGRAYGLVVDRWVDERLDPVRATEAAVRLLSDLHKRFGNWELAMAAYNMGHAGLARAIRKFNTNDFWELARYEAAIPWETTLYVPKVLAIAIVMNNRRAFGLADVEPDPPAAFDTVLVSPAQPLSGVAKAAKLPLAEVERLNPAYLAGRTPPSEAGAERRWAVRLPKNSGVRASTELLAASSDSAELEPFKVRFGDTLDSIAETTGASEARLRSINALRRNERLETETILLVPRRSAIHEPAAEPEVVVVPPRRFHYPTRRRVFYRALAGDTLGEIAAAFGVTEAEVFAWNTLDGSARLQSGMVLQLFVKKDQKLELVRHFADGDARVLVSGSPEFHDYFEGLKGNRRIVVAAKQGDSLGSIGARYGMSVGWMERVNRRSRNDKLETGERLVVYTKRDAVALSPTLAPEPLVPVAAPHPEALPPLASESPTAELRGPGAATNAAD